MVKIIFFLMMTLGIHAHNLPLEENCLACHKAQQIPSELIYRRYLMEYSTKIRMENAMLKYLKDPKKDVSIMPSQFFLKFPMKEKLSLNEETLKENIKAFVEYFDIKKKLILQK